MTDADHCLTKNCHQSGNGDGRAVAVVRPTKTLNRDVAPIGDDIEPVGETRADVEMGNEEDADPWEAQIPKVRMNPRNPTSREKQEHEDSGHAVYRSWCAACVEGRVGRRRRKRKDDSDRSFRLRFSDTGKRRHTFPILICRDSRYGQTGATCCERKGPTAYSIPFLVGFIKDLGFRRIILKCGYEPSTKALQNAVIHRMCRSGSDPQGPPEGDHMANGRVEMAVLRSEKRQCGTPRIFRCTKTPVYVSQMDSPLLSWLPRFAAQVMNKMRIGKDGKTSEMRRTGRRWRKPMARLGEKVWFS